MAETSPKIPADGDDRQREIWTGKIANAAPCDLETLFLHAIESRDMTGITMLMQADREFFTPELKRGISLAAEKGYADIVRFFIKEGADPDSFAGLPLRMAVANGHRDAAWELIKAGADIKRLNNDFMADAAASGRTDMMSWLWNNGVRSGLPKALYAAASAGKDESANFIMDKLNGDSGDRRLFAATMTALEKGHIAMARRMIASGFHRLGNETAMFETLFTKNDPDLMSFFLKNANIDQDTLTRSLDHASASQNAGMTAVLLDAGGRSSLDAAAVHLAPAIRALHDDARAQEPAEAAKTFRAAFAAGATPSSLARKDGRGTNGYLLAALSGQWETVEKAMALHPSEPVLPEYLTEKNALGRNALDILGRSGRLKDFFNDAVWEGRPHAQSQAALFAVHPEFRKEIAYEQILARLRLKQLDEKNAGKRRTFRGPPA